MWKSALMHTARLMNSTAKGPKKDGDKNAVAMLLHDNWVAYSKIRNLHRLCGRPQTYGNQSDV